MVRAGPSVFPALSANASTPLSAFHHGKLGFSFSGGGYLILYYVGIFKALEQLGIIQPGQAAPPVAGASSGALTTAAICSGQTAEEFYKTVSKLATDCFSRPRNCSGRMDTELRRTLEGFLPADAAKRCNGTSVVSVTLFGDGGKLRPANVRAYADRSDLISTLLSSAYIPLWSGSNISTPWRGKNAIDGGISNNEPCPPGVEYCVKVSSRPPDVPFLAPGQSPAQGVSVIYRYILRALSGRPLMAANVTKPALPNAPAEITPARAAAMRKAGLDIAPGLATPNPFSSEAWSELGMMPCDPATCEWLYKAGQLDAMAWAKATGIADAALKKMQQQQQQVARQPAPQGGGGDTAGGGGSGVLGLGIFGLRR